MFRRARFHPRFIVQYQRIVFREFPCSNLCAGVQPIRPESSSSHQWHNGGLGRRGLSRIINLARTAAELSAQIPSIVSARSILHDFYGRPISLCPTPPPPPKKTDVGTVSPSFPLLQNRPSALGVIADISQSRTFMRPIHGIVSARGRCGDDRNELCGKLNGP